MEKEAAFLCPHCGKKINNKLINSWKAEPRGTGKKAPAGQGQVPDKGVSHCIAIIDAAARKACKAGKTNDAILEKIIELVFVERNGIDIGYISSLRKIVKGDYDNGKYDHSGLGDYSGIAKILLRKLEM